MSDPQRALEAVRVLASAAGPQNLVGGQSDDLAAEAGRLPEGIDGGSTEGAQVAQLVEPGEEATRTTQTVADSKNDSQLEFLESIHRRKTGHCSRHPSISALS